MRSRFALAGRDTLFSMITDADITKLKETFITKDEFKSELNKFATKDELKEEIAGVREEISDVRVELGDLRGTVDTIATAVVQIQNTLDGIAGAIQDQRVENGAGAVHLARHDRQIDALALATNVALPD